MGSDRGSHIVSSFGPITVVPSKPSYSAHILHLPYTLANEGDIMSVENFTPSLPDYFTAKFVINGIDTDEYSLGPDSTGLIDSINDGDNIIDINYALRGNAFDIQLNTGSNYVINNIEAYINGDKVEIVTDE